MRYGAIPPLLALAGALCAQPVPEAEIRAAAQQAIGLLQHTGKVWYQKQTCYSCHHQALPPLVFDEARQRGIAVDETLAQQSVAKSFPMFDSLDQAIQSSHQFDPALNSGLALVAAHASAIGPSLTTAVHARLLANRQEVAGNWITADVRPPQAHSAFTATAVSLRALQLYMPRQLAAERKERIARATQWLAAAMPRTTEDRAFQLFGLAWAAGAPEALRRASAALLAEQRPDGGWGQLPALSSDAYATGETLAALHDAGAIPADHQAYRRGLRFLLRARHPDGSWLVRTRIHEHKLVSPPYFDTGFPHKEHQIASCMATSWAAIALMKALPRQPGNGVVAAKQLRGGTHPGWMETALFGTADELRSLLDKGLDANAATSGGTTALMMAAHDLEKVKLLLARGANVHAKSKTRYTALMVAAYFRGASEVVRLLLAKGAEAVPKAPLPLHNASPLFFAAMSGDTASVTLLAAKGASADHRMMMLGVFPLSALQLAIFQGDVAMMRELTRHGADIHKVEDPGITSLTAAVMTNRTETAKALLEMGAKIDQLDTAGMTALMHAASIDYGDTAMVETLLAAGADARARSKDGLTAMQLAARYGHARIDALLAPARR